VRQFLLTVTFVDFMLVNKNKIGDKIFSPIVSRDNNKTKSDGGGLLLEGNPISSFKIQGEARELVLGKWFDILGSLPDVSVVSFNACGIDGIRLQTLGELLRKLANLSGLYLPSNRIISLLPLKEFFENHTGLTDLWLQHNQITSISGLETATGLMVLNLKQNQITNISGLAKLTVLTHLNLYHNKIMSVLPLKNLTGLTGRLDLDHNQITDISGLAKLTRLTYLHLGVNKIMSVLPLKNLTGLTNLYLSRNQVTDISGLAKLTRLAKLWLHHNRIMSVLPLKNLTSLKHLDISRNPINKTDINALRMKLPNVDIRV
jgi:Leucine-rich repeat (LRR) protein